jgi:hypothetical protein
MFYALVLGYSGLAHAASATLVWDAPGPAQLPADFKDVQIYRALQTCTAAGPFAPLIVNGNPVVFTKPASGPFPTTYTDTTVPAIDGQICYVLRSSDVGGNFSASNVAVKVINLDPPAAFQNLQVPTVLP